MERSGRTSVGRGIVWCIVLCAHVSLLMLFSNTRSGSRYIRGGVQQEPLILFWFEPPALQTAPEDDLERESAIALRAAQPSSATDSSDVAISAPEEKKAPLDGFAEVGQVAESKAAEMMARQDKSCEGRKRPGSLLPKCQKDRPHRQWQPEPKRAGISGGLPYVRLGERCAFALIFIGCTFGKRPGPESYAEDMRDPDRPGSSVPELEDMGFGGLGSHAPDSIRNQGKDP